MKKWIFEYETDPDDIYFFDEDKLKELEDQENNDEDDTLPQATNRR